MMSWTPTWPNKTVLTGLHPRLQWIAPLFVLAMKDYGSAATVNFALDGKHSQHSAHGAGRAVDINHKDLHFPWAKFQDLRAWTAASYQFAAQLVRIANQLTRAVNQDQVEYYLVVEASHWHLEMTLNGAAPNIKGWAKGKYIYATQEVRTTIGGFLGEGGV
jgi:hypothetical protein